MFLEYQAVYI